MHNDIAHDVLIDEKGLILENQLCWGPVAVLVPFSDNASIAEVPYGVVDGSPSSSKLRVARSLRAALDQY